MTRTAEPGSATDRTRTSQRSLFTQTALGFDALVADIPLFSSKRERRLWLWVAVVVTEIYSTLWLAGTFEASLIGCLDEGIQAFLPSRVFDPIDIGVNTLAALMTILASVVIIRVRTWSSRERG
jgi:hypothetical protein